MTTVGPSNGPADNTRHSCPCPQCGFAVPLAGAANVLLRQAQQQIQALEAQVVLLDQKAAAAIDRWADYEDQLLVLRKRLASNGSGNTNTNPVAPASPTRTYFSPLGAANRLSALLSPRPAKSTPNTRAAAAAATAPLSSTAATPLPLLVTPMPTQSLSQPNIPSLSPIPKPPLSVNQGASVGAASSPPRPPGSFPFFGRSTPSPSPAQSPAATPQSNALSTKDLLDALTREQKLRRQAEGRLQDTSREVEELSVSLFEQANEMVAEERRARARLEARVAVLEQRDTDKKHRLERLEQAMDRIERLRAMLGVGADGLPTGTRAMTKLNPNRSLQDGEPSRLEHRSVSAHA
ncbi:hypothetical protein SEPCBS57363_002402 [Sporothrix epigloea]|uniref:GDP/GTP exchange factor Sec2 N-terminal domain-containing protein n=1 Tax=Sporothrix epigloea TaxID=1892477 RepID=A0ABP0DFP2_9PEZI